MLEKLAAGMLGSMAQSLFGGMLGGANKTEAASGVFSTLLAKPETDITEDGVNLSDDVSAGTADALASLKEMTSGGLEGYWKFVMKQLREKAMEEMNISEADLAKMTPEERKVVEDKITEKVKEALAKMMGTTPEEAAKMMAQVQGVPVTQDLLNEAKKAYKEDVKLV